MITILLQAVSIYLLTCLLTSCVLSVFLFKLKIVHTPKISKLSEPLQSGIIC